MLKKASFNASAIGNRRQNSPSKQHRESIARSFDSDKVKSTHKPANRSIIFQPAFNSIQHKSYLSYIRAPSDGPIHFPCASPPRHHTSIQISTKSKLLERSVQGCSRPHLWWAYPRRFKFIYELKLNTSTYNRTPHTPGFGQYTQFYLYLAFMEMFFVFCFFEYYLVQCRNDNRPCIRLIECWIKGGFQMQSCRLCCVYGAHSDVLREVASTWSKAFKNILHNIVLGISHF